MYKRAIIVCFLFITSLLQADYQYDLAVCAIFKDEAPWLKEWIEYHKLVGVKHFRLYNNQSEDNYLEVLQPYIQSGEVTVIDWPNGSPTGGWVYHTQWPALANGIASLNGIAKWVALIDIDEFIFPVEKNDIISFLANYEECPAIAINWQCYGTSHLWKIPKNKLMIEALILRAPENSAHNIPVKSIVRPEQIDTINAGNPPHTWTILGAGKTTVTPSKKEYYQGLIEVDKIKVNHYMYRTEEYFIKYKIPKKERMEGIKWEEGYNMGERGFNEIKDTTMSRYVPTLKTIIFGGSK